jgi:hypothetical protein
MACNEEKTANTLYATDWSAGPNPNNLVSAPVWIADSEAWPPRNPVSCGDRASQRGMDKSPTDGGLWLAAQALVAHLKK